MARQELPTTFIPVTKLLFIKAFLVVLMAACNQSSRNSVKKSSEQKTPVTVADQDDTNITCWGVGVLEFGDDLAAIGEKVGKENVSTDSLFLEGDFDRLITKVWKGSPKEITIIWKEAKPPFKTIRTFEISHRDSPYQFSNGIKVGTSLNEIVKLNGGEAITLYGFGWDYGGTFIDFGKGKLKGDLPCFGGVFQMQTEAADAEIQQVMGDQEISSRAPAFRKYQAILSEIRVSENGTE